MRNRNHTKYYMNKWRNVSMKENKGFSLVELIVVVAIMAVLVVLAAECSSSSHLTSRRVRPMT